VRAATAAVTSKGAVLRSAADHPPLRQPGEQVCQRRLIQFGVEDRFEWRAARPRERGAEGRERQFARAPALQLRADDVHKNFATERALGEPPHHRALVGGERQVVGLARRDLRERRVAPGDRGERDALAQALRLRRLRAKLLL
jgi:hypothetical protein